MKRLVYVSLLLAYAVPCAAGVTISIDNGRVTLDAQDATLHQILAEWSRVGRTQIANLERVGGGPVTLRFENLPEKQALDIILRTIPGYIAAPRQVFLADASIYERILILPTTTAVAAPGTHAPPSFSGGLGATNRPAFRPMPMQAGGLATPPPPQDPADQTDDTAAAATAAGLPPPLPGAPSGVPGVASPPASAASPMPLTAAGLSQPTAIQTPANPWNAPPGTALPSLAAPPPPPPAPPAATPRPQADR